MGVITSTMMMMRMTVMNIVMMINIILMMKMMKKMLVMMVMKIITTYLSIGHILNVAAILFNIMQPMLAGDVWNYDVVGPVTHINAVKYT